MARSLVIVESPAKAKTINKYLGKDFVVKSSFGHIRDLPTSGGEGSEEKEEKAKPAAKSKVKADPAAKAARAQTALVRRMGVDPEHGWVARYEVVPGKEKNLRELQEAAAKAETIWLASDLDREGEAIAWHLREVIGGDPAKYRRVVFNEITKSAIQEAFAHPGEVNQDRVNAQQARRFLDRVVGFMVSPLLWAKVARGLSAGRVQSVAVRLVVEREREIRAFKPDEYWEVHARLAKGAAPLRAEVVREDGSPFKPVTEAAASAAVAALQGAAYRVVASEDKAQRANPTAPFITSTLQAAASTRLGFSVKKTMTLAQRLYEAGHITYMRTDSVNLSAQALEMVRGHIKAAYGERYLPAQANVYRSKQGAQEAHEAIRPTEVAVAPEGLDVERDAQRLYELIWRQFVACQMPPAEFDTTTVTIQAGRFELRAGGRVLRFDGWQKVLPPAKQEDQQLPRLAAGDQLALQGLDPTQHFTKPPARFSEATLVRELEKRGIGRPSTYAAIISTIQERGYVRLDSRRFHAEKLGEIVTARLCEAFPALMDYGFTAGLETELDAIAEAREDWKRALDRFYGDFKGKLDHAADAMRPSQPVPTAIACSKCSRPLAVRVARTGVFLSCTGYSLPPKERCTATINLVPGRESEAVAEGPDSEADEASEAEARALHDQRRCPKCGTAMDAWLVDEKRRLHVCGRNPECDGTVVEEGQFKLKGYDGPSLPCDKCGKPMQLKTGRFGKYFGCTGYPVCDNTRKLLRSGEAAPPKAKPVPMPELPCSKGPGHMVLRDGASGLFLAASTYPRVRETRNPQVADLKRHRADLDPKFLFLADAPERDPEGNPVTIRFSKKSKTHYLASEKDGKPSGWSRIWDGSAWVEAKES
ncbi:MAG: type I DNA topoisomerase [Planctomycetes bacterium]|nr:type I DNA topoisomerase [Planctomycetota bacterium]